MSYRPRGALARALFEKLHNDTDLDNIDMKFVSLYNFIISTYLQNYNI